MAHFYGQMCGNRGETTRQGGKSSGIGGHLRGWDIGAQVYCRYDEKNDRDIVDVYITGGSGHQAGLGHVGSYSRSKRTGKVNSTTGGLIMRQYKVTVTRAIEEQKEFIVTAESESAAQSEALNRAMDTVWDMSRGAVDYQVYDCEKLSFTYFRPVPGRYKGVPENVLFSSVEEGQIFYPATGIGDWVEVSDDEVENPRIAMSKRMD